jgi:hypothetical protein
VRTRAGEEFETGVVRERDARMEDEHAGKS